MGIINVCNFYNPDYPFIYTEPTYNYNADIHVKTTVLPAPVFDKVRATKNILSKKVIIDNYYASNDLNIAVDRHIRNQRRRNGIFIDESGHSKYKYEDDLVFYTTLEAAKMKKRPDECIYVCRVSDYCVINTRFPILYFRVSKLWMDKNKKNEYYLSSHIRKLYTEYYKNTRKQQNLDYEQEYIKKYKYPFQRHITSKRLKLK